MKNMKFWRTALVATLVLTVMLSVTGGTIAWFTDSVESKSNKIEAGNLDIDLYMYNEKNGQYEEITDASAPIFGGAASLVAQNNNADTLWEPGKTQVAYLKLVNNGNLALKYNVGLNVLSETNKLSQAMLYAITPNAKKGDVNVWKADVAKSVALGQQNASDVVSMAVGAEHYFALSVHMAEEAGNAYQGGTAEFDITVYATQDTVEADSFNNQYDAGAVPTIVNVNTAEAAQAALDQAAANTVINLAPGVNYGTLTFRRNAYSKGVDISSIGGDEDGNEKYSRYEDITILGAEGATVEQITFANGREEDNTIWNYIDVKNLTIKNVTFTGEKTAVMIPEGFDLAIDGLSLIDCKMSDTDGADRFVYQPRSGYKSINDKETGEYVMTSGVKNLTITGCEVVGAHQVIEARPMENITITNNTFKGIKARDILLSVISGSYAGTIDISGNTSIGGQERFVRGSGIGDATLVIKNNVITDYAGKDVNGFIADYIKVTGATGAVEINGNEATPAAEFVGQEMKITVTK